MAAAIGRPVRALCQRRPDASPRALGILPLVLIALAIWRDKLAGWRNLESIRAYYYSGGAAAFLGMLAALALFLFTYRGYDNSERDWSRAKRSPARA